MSVSVILTAYKRDYFNEQIQAILKQTIKPKVIYIWQNGNYINIDKYRQKYNVKIIKSDENFKFHGRFAFALLMQTEYVMIFDDDIIPGKHWINNCLTLCNEKNCIVGQNGRFYDTKTKKYYGLGSGKNLNFLSNPTKAHLVGHCWFFKKKWLSYMWKQEPFSYENGEDIHFCFSAKLFGNIDSYVAGQSTKHNKGDLKDSIYGVDKFASHKILSNHNKIRSDIAESFIKLGWKP